MHIAGNEAVPCIFSNYSGGVWVGLHAEGGGVSRNVCLCLPLCGRGQALQTNLPSFYNPPEPLHTTLNNTATNYTPQPSHLYSINSGV